MCEVEIYNGKAFGGDRKDLRFTATLILPSTFIVNLENLINYKFNKYLENSYDDHLESQKKLWIYNLKAEILK